MAVIKVIKKSKGNNANTGFNPAALPEYISIEAATLALGVGKPFRYLQANINGVSSPNNSVIGITQ